ncbi:FkbM family methyltransferase [Flavobacterium yafengii]|uniref:FkbM family methyltransferase n=1 Tax=Flavobacterium yafengii TaxID=3041253 RepID=UPI0024A884C9|nr:FkbM family methyltransferase [Flavobacterium yafengii]MDI5898172.1 FkbM family methyltransferase [Flavobacterium yafengii]
MKKLVYRIWNALNLKLIQPLKHYFLPKENRILIYLGLHKGSSFDQLISSHKLCYGFEANPELYKNLIKKYRFYRNVHIINAAVTDYNGVIKFNISSNNGLSSSIGEFKQNWPNDIKMLYTIEVAALRLSDFLDERNIDFIDTYCSDIQGNDLTVLKTLSYWIENKKIGSITCETSKDSYQNIYELGDNSESGFKELLDKNYYLAAKGWGVLKDGEYVEVEDSWWEMDCKWKVKE